MSSKGWGLQLNLWMGFPKGKLSCSLKKCFSARCLLGKAIEYSGQSTKFRTEASKIILVGESQNTNRINVYLHCKEIKVLLNSFTALFIYTCPGYKSGLLQRHGCSAHVLQSYDPVWDTTFVALLQREDKALSVWSWGFMWTFTNAVNMQINCCWNSCWLALLGLND